MAAKEFLKKWVRALRSGEYEQTQGALMDSFDGNKAYCCLGVACVLRSEELGVDPQTLSVHPERTFDDNGFAGEWLFPEDVQEDIAALNDSGKTFEELADHIEKEFINADTATDNGEGSTRTPEQA